MKTTEFSSTSNYLFSFIVRTFIFVLCTFTFLSCDDDPTHNAKSPVLGNLSFEPSATVAPNDSVTAIISYEEAGLDVYKIDFSYSVVGKNPVNGKDSTFLSGSWTEVDPLKHQPTFGFRAPLETGSYRVNVKATRVNYSTSGPNGEIYGNPSSTSGQIIVR